MKENDNGMGFSAFVRNALREGSSGVREAVENVRMKHVSPVGRRGAVNVVGSVAYCALTLAGCGDLGAAPVVVRVVDPPARSTPTEAVVLAHRILERESDDLLVDTGQRRELAREIDLVLSRIRETYPTLADMPVLQRYKFGVLMLGLDPGLSRAVHVLLPTGQMPTGPLHTGYEDFDALNARLGLSAVELYVGMNVGAFYFDESLNVGEAIRAYEMVEGVEFVEVNGFDGPDIDAVKSQGTWHVAVRRAWGDCPAGCIFQEIFFFTVKGSDVERIERAQAMDMIQFVDLLKNTGWSGWEREMEISPDDRELM